MVVLYKIINLGLTVHASHKNEAKIPFKEFHLIKECLIKPFFTLYCGLKCSIKN